MNITYSRCSIEDQLWSPLDMVTADWERELYKPNSWAKHKAYELPIEVTIPYSPVVVFFVVVVFRFFFLTGSRNGVVVNVYWNNWSLVVP